MDKVWGKRTPLSTFIPGAIAGYIVFGRNDKINLQVGRERERERERERQRERGGSEL